MILGPRRPAALSLVGAASPAPSRPVADVSYRSAPQFHVFPGPQPLVLAVQGSRLFAVDEDLGQLLSLGDSGAIAELEQYAELASPPLLPEDAGPPPIALSLNIAQACNLACSYCYADEGRFRGTAKLMPIQIARRAIDRLFDDTEAPRLAIGFIGGEPFLNRPVLEDAVSYAAKRAEADGRRVAFSIATNATLLNDSDCDLLRSHGFSVSVSVDGDQVLHDQQRPTHYGEGSYHRTIASLRPLLNDPGDARIAARATVTRLDLQIANRVEHLTSLGFTEVGVSPARTSASPALAFREDDWLPFLSEMRIAGDRETRRILAGARPVFSNLANALGRLHRGSCRPLPCGSGASYVSVGADGDYWTCHRTVGDPRFQLGGVGSGLDESSRQSFVRERLVDRVEPCRACWARYLCGGGCHAEVAAAGRTGCDYIRGWLEYCIRTYDRLLSESPGFFTHLATETA